MSIKLPMGKSSLDHNIANMKLNESGYTVPWAMYHDSNRNLFLDGQYIINHEPGGSAQMFVWRDEKGYHIDATSCRKHLWSINDHELDNSPISVTTCKF